MHQRENRKQKGGRDFLLSICLMFLTTWPQHWHLASAVQPMSVSSQALEMRLPPSGGEAPAAAQQPVFPELSWFQLEVCCSVFPPLTRLTDNLLKEGILNTAPTLRDIKPHLPLSLLWPGSTHLIFTAFKPLVSPTVVEVTYYKGHVCPGCLHMDSFRETSPLLIPLGLEITKNQ